MFTGIISEGRSDQEIIKNILKGKLNLDASDTHSIRPEDRFDETDLNDKSRQYSNWQLVKKDCKDKTEFDRFFSIAEERIIVVHIDTAEAELPGYDVKRPAKKNNPDYTQQLREIVKNKINEWLGNCYSNVIRYAIAIEETDAWVLTIYEKEKKDTCLFQNPKKRLEFIISQNNLTKKQRQNNEKSKPARLSV